MDLFMDWIDKVKSKKFEHETDHGWDAVGF